MRVERSRLLESRHARDHADRQSVILKECLMGWFAFDAILGSVLVYRMHGASPLVIPSRVTLQSAKCIGPAPNHFNSCGVARTYVVVGWAAITVNLPALRQIQVVLRCLRLVG